MSDTQANARRAGGAESGDSAVLLLDGSGRVSAAGAEAARLFGREPGQLRGRALSEIFRRIPDSIYAWLSALAEAAEPPVPLQFQLDAARGDGLLVALDAVLYGIRAGTHADEGAVAGLVLRHSSGLVLKSELLMAQREVIDQVAAGADLRATLRAVARFAERCMTGEIFCLISPIDPQGQFEAGVCPTLPEDVARLQAGHRAGSAWSPATQATGAGLPRIAADLGEHASWSEFALQLQRHGLTASWALPVRGGRGDVVCAVLEFLLPVRRGPSRSESGLMEELAELVRLAIDLHGLAQALRDSALARRVAEGQVMQQEAHLTALVNTALDAVISIDVDGRVTLWNRPAESLFGWSSAETVGRPLSDFIIPPEMRQAHNDGIRRVVATGHGPLLGRRIEITAIDRAGRRFPVELSINRMPGDGGFSAFLRDIGDRRRADAALKTSEERLKQVIDASADGFWDLRFDGGGSLMSDRCATMLGRDPSKLVPRAPHEQAWLHPADRPAVQRAWQRHLEGQAPRYESEHRCQAADGSWRWVLERGRVVERDGGGRVQRVVGVVTDVTERRALEASLSSAERLESLGLVTGGLVRQFDELFGIIRAHASLANVEARLPARVGESLEVIQLTVARAKALARSVLGLSAGATGGASLVSVASALREGMQLIRAGLPRTVELSVEDRAAGRDLVRVDTALLQQALVNMVLRACEAVGNAGKVVLRVEPSGAATLAIRCIDSGPPLGPEAAARIGEVTDEAAQGRSALGMAAVRRFAESSGGTLHGAHTGEGNVITVELPLEAGEVPMERPVVALCEDHPLLGPMITEVLHAVGHRVLRAERAERLVPLLRSERAGSVAIVDEAGWKVVSAGWHAACHEAGVRPGVVVLGDRVGGPTGPGFDWLAKPFTVETLLASVSRVSTWSASMAQRS